MPTHKGKRVGFAECLAFRTFRQLGQAGILICKPSAVKQKASSQGREGEMCNPILNFSLKS